MGKNGVQRVGYQTDQDQYAAEHCSNKEAGLALVFGRRLSDPEGVDECVDEEAKGVHGHLDGLSSVGDAEFAERWKEGLHPTKPGDHPTFAHWFACHDRIGRIYLRCKSSKEIVYGHRCCYPHR
jgi:hypothetical protein